MRCEAIDDNPCAVFPRLSKTDFYELVLRTNFTSSHIYPSVVSTAVRLVPLSQWNFTKLSTETGYEAEINFNNKRGRSLIVAGLKGRCYDRDPSFEK
ncbi:hypothetical protein AVEN_199019-1 [Araneus ventricosus]|uniref:Vanin C-terminal domain-containing protein n=1 Tax=Araneus ventricosus TaxID=182803 RepID=A0A4Y2EE10_ARAVE|nr:hypothetical protein AVEN_82120-1 [Araneus ventricosus]GBM26349.1 hypothetical protein AVEN_233394-1 [Araneus ventricosus]GBM26424.1 hypothetical protein AVEN_46735-1 [Araneus ventricosus]GBM26474.1 hypothetical protein AVEN_132530-1 [Araneus ventricosus]GBM26499.1 hypothetical protein AVEN_199019-1 [Araneus ventricosus]